MKRYLPHLALGLIFFALQVILYRISAQITFGELFDADCYMRLLRVHHLLAEGSWFDEIIPGSNAPYGESSHWGRPLDVLLILGALPFRLFFNLKDSLFWWGVWFSPVMQVLSVTALAWTASPVLKPFSRLHLGVFFLCQPELISYYMAGRPDHHSLLIFCLVIITGQILRILILPVTHRLLIATGFMQALMLWISVEALAVCLLTQLILGLAWLAQGPDSARKNLILSLSQFCGVLAALLIETPDLIFRMNIYDRLCGLNLLVFGTQTLFWLLIFVVEKQRPVVLSLKFRLFASAAGTIACLAVIWLFSPRFFHGPFSNVDPRLVLLWLHNVREVQPLATSICSILPQMITWLAPVFLVIPFFIMDLPKRRKDPRSFWTGLYFFFGTILFVFLTLLQIRWAAYAEFMLIFPLALILSRLLDRIEPCMKPDWFRPLRAVLLLVFAAGYIPFVLLCNRHTAETQAPETKTLTSVGGGTLMELTAWLKDNPLFSSHTQRIVALLDFGPEILYRSGMEVIATPYHRNEAGVLFVYDLMNRDTDAGAKKDVEARSVTLILLTNSSVETGFYSQSGKKNTFRDRLQKKLLPPWLSEVPLPETLNSSFRLFRVTL